MNASLVSEQMGVYANVAVLHGGGLWVDRGVAYVWFKKKKSPLKNQ